MKPLTLLFAGLCLSGCASLQSVLPSEEPAPPVAVDPATAEGVRPQARPDTAPPPSDPVAAPAAPGALGVTIASLGNPAEPGLWLKTPLVSARQPGTVRRGAASVAVTLIPLDGPATAGSRMSLDAFQALGVPLTDLPEVSVSAG